MRKAAIFATAMLVGSSLLAAAAGAPAGPAHPVGDRPSWYTPRLHAQVLTAGPRGVPLPASARIPVSSLAFVGIRPGSLILVDDGAGGISLCSTNFVFTGSTTRSRRGSARRSAGTQGATYFIGTAGHCGQVGDQVTMVFLPLGLVNIGRIVKSVSPPVDREGNFDTSKLDFALISVDPALNQWVSPSMAWWGGPTGAFTGDGIQPILHAGWGLGVGTGGTPRGALAYAWNIGSEYRFQGAITPGDSGSGAIVAGGLAAGNITHLAVDGAETPPVWNGGSTITAILKHLGSGYRLATCSLPVPWPLPGCPPV